MPPMNSYEATLFETLQETSLVAVLMIEDARDAIPVAEALLAGGVKAMELTLRTEAAWEALSEIKRGVPEMIAGLGTILQPEQVTMAVAAGAASGSYRDLDSLSVSSMSACCTASGRVE